LTCWWNTYQGLNDPDHALGAASRLLQVDPSNTKAIYLSVAIKKSQCSRTIDAKTASQPIRRPVTMPRRWPRGVSWLPRRQESPTPTGRSRPRRPNPIFHSAIALDDIVSKGDVKAGISEYRTELMLFPPDATRAGRGWWILLNLAEAYVKPEAKDLAQAVWFYARAWDYAPATFKGAIETKLEYWYKKFHGALDGLDDIKAQAMATVFPPGTLIIKPADTLREDPQDLANNS